MQVFPGVASERETRVSYVLRPFTEADFPAIVAVHNRLYPDDATTVEETAYYQTKVFDETHFFRQRLVAEAADGEVIAFGSLHHLMYEHHPDRYELEIQVDPRRQRLGVGTSLYTRLLATAHERRAISVRAHTWEGHEATTAFLQKRGFREMKRDLESALDVERFDFAPFVGAEDRVANQSIVITTLAAELASQPDALQRLHALCSECERDVPSVHPATPVGLELFVQMTVDSPNTLHEAYFIAKDGLEYVGMSALYPHPGDAHVLYQGLTGVARSHRGRGIAMALKLTGIRYARARHIRQIRTDNDAVNKPMLGINVALGFRRRLAWIDWQKDLT